MAERYSRLFSLPEGLYSRGAPLIIAAGALLMDNQNVRILAQLKLRSISDKLIRSARVLIIGRSVGGEELCREEYEYAQLNVERDAVFGTREAISLPDMAVRGFDVQLLSVSFADGSRYIGAGAEWKPLPEQAELTQLLFDTELVRQYKLEAGSMSRYVPLEAEDLWLCTCGEINHEGEACRQCERTLAYCKANLNVDRLRENKSLRLNAEAAQAAIDDAKRQSRGRIVRRVLYVLVPLLLIAGGVFGFYKFNTMRAALYEEATALFEVGEYAEAARRFEKLGRFRDSNTRAATSRNADATIAAYARAGRFLENERYDDAYDAYLALGDYADSSQLALEALYRKGLALIEGEQFEQAHEVFLGLCSYRNAAVIAAHFFDRRLSEEVSMNQECGGPLTIRYRYDSFGRIAEKTELFSAYDGMEDRVSVYSYAADGSWTVTTGDAVSYYDPQGSLLGKGSPSSFRYEYEFYPDGAVHYCTGFDAKTGEYLSSAAYDEHGGLVSSQGSDNVSYTLVNEYQGELLVKQERYSGDGTMLGRTSFEYNDDGLVKRASFLTPGASVAVTTLYKNGPVYAPDAEK